jgi:hypothetical protein
LCLSGHFADSYAAVAAPPTVTPAASPCDTDYMASLESRAWLEAQREITQNQNLIFKPDSVLEYTCFDLHLNILAAEATNMFSESNRWSIYYMPSTNAMDNALRDVVGNALLQYITANYETSATGTYDLLGGNLTGVDHNFAPVVSSNSYTCDIMNKVWMQAKCRDFIPTTAFVPPKDGFFTFADYATHPDKRALPSACTAAPLPRWALEITTSTGAGTPWTEDNFNTFVEMFLYKIPAAVSCSHVKPIPTGLTVARPKETPASYQEKVCAAPGCHYIPAGGKKLNGALAGAEGCYPSTL